MDDQKWRNQLETLIASPKFGQAIIEYQYMKLDASIIFADNDCYSTCDFDSIIKASIILPIPQVRTEILQVYAELRVDNPTLFDACWLDSPAQQECAQEARAALEEQIRYHGAIAIENRKQERHTDKLIA